MAQQYRVRIRLSDGKSFRDLGLFDNLEDTYALIRAYGKSERSSRKYYIDVVETKLFSVVTSKVAGKRLDEIRKEKEDE